MLCRLHLRGDGLSTGVASEICDRVNACAFLRRRDIYLYVDGAYVGTSDRKSIVVASEEMSWQQSASAFCAYLEAASQQIRRLWHQSNFRRYNGKHSSIEGACI